MKFRLWIPLICFAYLTSTSFADEACYDLYC
jgi:hypothetical protein